MEVYQKDDAGKNLKKAIVISLFASFLQASCTLLQVVESAAHPSRFVGEKWAEEFNPIQESLPATQSQLPQDWASEFKGTCSSAEFLLSIITST